MLYPRKVQGAVLALGLAACLSAPAFAALPLPQPMQKGDVTYISGGIGLREQHALEAEAHNYNLVITNANREGEFTTNTGLVIQSKNGQDVLDVANTGPLFYAKLPLGDYIIHAVNDGQHRIRDVKIAARGTADVHLIWPQSG